MTQTRDLIQSSPQSDRDLNQHASTITLSALGTMLKNIIGAASLILSGHCAADMPNIEHIDVYTTEDTRVTIPQAFQSVTRVFNLDDFQTQQQYVTALVNQAHRRAPDSIMTVVESPEMKAALEKMSAAAKRITDAWSLNLKTLPSTVINNSFVLEGVSDVNEAAQRFHQHWQQHGINQ